jgi:hypothetical protein
MKFNKVVYVRYFPLTKAIYTDLYFEELMKNNIQVEYLDVTTLFYLKKVTTEPYYFAGTVKIDSYELLAAYLNKQDNNNTLYISIMTFEWRVFKLYRLFTKYNLKLGVFARGVFPSISKFSEGYTIKSFFWALSFSGLSNFLKNKIALFAKKIRIIKSYDYLFKAGDYGYYGLGIGSEIDIQKAVIIEVNTVDYDQYLIKKGAFCSKIDEYIVFLDQYLPYHPDTRFFDIKTVEPEPYYKELNSFFDKIERKTSQKVVIAAHPKADKYRGYNPYNNRDIYFDQSNDLVKGASLVLTHASTAICYPICYQKMIVLLVSDYLNEILPHFLLVAKSIVNSCEATLISIDKDDDFQIAEKINSEKYSDFKYNYLTSKESEGQLSGNIFIEFLNSKI